MALETVSRKFAELSLAFEELIAMLRIYGEERWAKLIEDDLFFLRKGNPYGATRFLSYFGGMGSLNDLVLCQANGHQVADSAQHEVNEKLRTLLHNAWELAEEISGNAT